MNLRITIPIFILCFTLLALVSGDSFGQNITTDNNNVPEQNDIKQFLIEFIRKIQKQYQKENSSFVNSTSHIIALEMDKTLAILEMEFNLALNPSRFGFSKNQSLKIRDCILFDTVKRRKQADQFMHFLKNKPEQTLKGYHYFDWYDYQRVMDVNRLCREVAMDVLEENSNLTGNDFKPPSIFTIVSNLLTNRRFIIPGTMWCGTGDIAHTYWDLGTTPEIDMCCREHDHCPVRLLPEEEQYGDKNRGLVTVSVCECDRRLQKCLENVGTKPAKANDKEPVVFNPALNDFGRKISWMYFSLFNIQCLEERGHLDQIVIADNGTKVCRPIPQFKIQNMPTNYYNLGDLDWGKTIQQNI